MSAYTPDFETALKAELFKRDDHAAAIRAVLELPHQLRMHGLRSMMFLGAVVIAAQGDARASALKGIRRAILGMDTILDFLERGHVEECCPEIAALLAEAVRENGDHIRTFRGFRDELAEIVRQIEADGAPGAGRYDEMMASSYNLYHPSMIALTDGMSRVTARWRDRFSDRAAQARSRALASQARIDEIARTVRLISLNARVEAARAGDAGRAFGVIAEEIKVLSEQTETASAEIGTALSEIMENLQTL